MKIAAKIKYKTRLALGQQPVIQFGIPRSGSTLVYNLLRELLPSPYFILKTHALRPKDLQQKIVATYRNPLDVMASVFESHGLAVTDEEIRKQLFLLSKHGLWDVFELKHKPNALLLRYEEFVGNFALLFDEIGHFFEIDIPQGQRQALSDRYDIQKVKQSIDPAKDFSHKDKRGFHGKHVSRFEGGSGYFSDVFEPGQIEYMQRYFSFFMQEMGYPSAD